MPTAEALQVFYGTVPLVAAILLTNWNNNKRMDDLKTSLNKRMDDLTTTLNKRIDDLTTTVNTGFSDLKTSVNKLETRVSDLEKVSRLIAG